jgi:uncharacterized protein
LSQDKNVNALAWEIPRPLGVGLPYYASVDAGLYREGLLDFVELTPETICRPTQAADGDAFVFDTEQWVRARATCGDLPLAVHGVELSIGSSCGWNLAYITMLEKLQLEWPFVWHSEHLHFQTVFDETRVISTGVPLPLPLTSDSVNLVAGRAATLTQRFGTPFLLENGAHYFPKLPRDEDIPDEAAFMNRIVEKGCCGQLLDLHNVYCNSINHGFDPFAFIDRLALDRVIEIHVAGGSEQDGIWMDAHDSRVPKLVWDLVEYAVPRCPNLGGLLFEVLEEYVPLLGAAVIAEEVVRAKTIWRKHKR